MKNGAIILVTGGARSGKSSFSETYAEKVSPSRVYVATCPCLDAEMRDRIERHQERRKNRNWQTIEEQTDLVAAVGRAGKTGAGVLLIDCLTLWVNNLQYRGECAGTPLTEAAIAAASTELIAALRCFPGTSVLVINEVGCGIVPDNPASRLFRDCSGRCAQTIAAAADEVYLCAAGLPLRLK